MSGAAPGEGDKERAGSEPTGPAATGLSAAAAGELPLRRVVRITNPLGLHHRAADRFCRTAQRFQARVVVRNGELAADGKNIWDLLGLIVLPDQEVVLETDGPDAAQALEVLTEVLGSPNGENYVI